MATIRDVAREAGVSVMTASRVANNHTGVSDTTRVKVSEVMKRLGYQPDQLAQALRNGGTNTIGFIVSDVENAFYMKAIAAMEQRFKEQGYSVLISFSNENPQLEMDSMNMMLGARVAGMFVTPVKRDDNHLKALMKKHHVPVVQLYRNVYQNVDSLVVDDSYGAFIATQILLRAGHRRILLLDVDWEGRAKGYCGAFEEAGVSVDHRYILTCRLTDNEEIRIKGAVEELTPTAILAGTNLLGHDAISVCLQMGLKIPRDMSLIIQDDIAWVSLFEVTAIRHPMQKLAQEAVDIMLEKIQYFRACSQGDALRTPVHHVVRPTLVERASVGKITQR